MKMMNTVVAAAAALTLGAAAHGAVLVNETFTYADGNLVGNDPAIGGAWAAHSGAGAIPVQVTSGAAVVAQGSGSREDVNSGFEGGFAAGAGDVLYSAFDLTINDPAAAIVDANFAHMLQGTSAFASRLWVTAPSASGYRIALSGDNSITDLDGEVRSDDLAFGTTYRVVTHYDYDTGDATLWIDPTGTAVSPIGTSVTATDGFSDEVHAYAFRQAGGNTSQIIDNLEVGLVPEPTSLAVLGLGGLGLLGRRRR